MSAFLAYLNRRFYVFCRMLCRYFSAYYCRARVWKMHYVPAEGAALLVCNHQSFLDPVLAAMALARPASFMARETLFRNRFFGPLINVLGAYPVRRGEADLAAIKETLRRLKSGHLVVIFPEGTRSPDGRIGPMLPGLAAIAKKARVPLVPTIIDGVFQAWPKGQPFPSPADVVVEYGPPIMPEEYADWTAEQLMTELRQRLITMQTRWHSRVPHRRLKWWTQQPGPVQPSEIAI